jgi:hypothetical protein
MVASKITPPCPEAVLPRIWLVVIIRIGGSQMGNNQSCAAPLPSRQPCRCEPLADQG